MRKQAGWWSEDPLGGDTPLDMIGDVQKKKPAQAAAFLKKKLLDKGFGKVYSALGVWNFVMLSDKPEYVKEFKRLNSIVKNTAKNLLLLLEEEEEKRDNGKSFDWEIDDWNTSRVKKYLTGYATGKIFPNVGYHGKFANKRIKSEILKTAEKDSKFRDQLVARLKQAKNKTHVVNTKLIISIRGWDEDEFSSSGMNIKVKGFLINNDFGWSYPFRMIYSPRNSSWNEGIEDLYVDGNEVKKGNPFWGVFQFLAEQGKISLN